MELCMKLKGLGKGLSYSMSLLGMVFGFSAQGHAGAMGPVTALSTPGKIYVGVFGGGGASTNVSIAQYGTAFFPEDTIGPLAVNGFGHTDTRGVGIVGGQVGYQWSSISLNLFNSLSGITPAVELEGYYVGKSTFTGHDINNETASLPEHDFLVSYPLNTAVFLANAVANFDLSNVNRVHPYVGAGIGAAVLSISGADSTQVAPPEGGVNHYNGNPSDKDATFAAQVKAGLNFDVTSNVNIFAEYRWLYVSNSDYRFGSTVYPAHVPTSPWLVELGSQSYNMGAAGIRFSI